MTAKADAKKPSPRKPTDNTRTYQKVWDTLSVIDTAEHQETKNMGARSATYLSWAHAWGVMMNHFPDMMVEFTRFDRVSPHPAGQYVSNDVQFYPDGSAAVECMVLIPVGDGNNLVRHFTLPVMDHKQNAIKSPDAWQINSAKQRCMVKVFALFGLAHHLYAGEDVPLSPSEQSAGGIAPSDGAIHQNDPFALNTPSQGPVEVLPSVDINDDMPTDDTVISLAGAQPSAPSAPSVLDSEIDPETGEVIEQPPFFLPGQYQQLRGYADNGSWSQIEEFITAFITECTDVSTITVFRRACDYAMRTMEPHDVNTYARCKAIFGAQWAAIKAAEGQTT